MNWRVPPRGDGRGEVCLWAGLVTYISVVPYYQWGRRLQLDLAWGLAVRYLPFVLILGATVWAAARGKRGDAAVMGSRSVAVGLVLYLGAGLASLVGAQHVAIGAAKWVYFAATGPLVFLVVAHMEAERAVVLVQVVAAVGVAVAGFGLAEWVISCWGLAGSGSMIAGAFQHHSVMGTYLAAVLPLAATQVVGRGGWRWRAAVGTVGVALMLSFSRGAWLAAVAGSGAVVRPRRSWARGAAIAGLSAVLVWPALGAGNPGASVWSWAWNTEMGTQWQRVVERTAHYRQVEAHRLAMVGTVGRILTEKPLTGIGFGNYTRVFEAYDRGRRPAWVTARTTDNMYLMVAAETGLLGLCGFLVTLGAIGARLGQHLRGGASGAASAVGPTAALVALACNMVFWDVLNHPTLRIMFWLLAGLGWALTPRPAAAGPVT